jgi:hypothetical protein
VIRQSWAYLSAILRPLLRRFVPLFEKIHAASIPFGFAINLAEQRQAGLGWHDILSLGNQKTLLLQPADDLGSGHLVV